MSGVAILSLLALAACADADPVPATADPSGSAATETSTTTAPAGEPTAGTLCAQFPSQDPVYPADELEGWWNTTPTDPQSGDVILDPVEWDDARIREHPRVAVVDTQAGYWATWDRTTCGATDVEYAPVMKDHWPELSYVIVDIDSGELLESVELAEVGDGSDLATTA